MKRAIAALGPHGLLIAIAIAIGAASNSAASAEGAAEAGQHAEAAEAAGLPESILQPPRSEASGESPLKLVGTWYVLVHYRDSQPGEPSALQWEDRLWRFARRSSGLVWTDYPKVALTDERGRFERTQNDRLARTFGGFEPNAAQLAEIAAGLEIVDRGSRAKTLRGSDAGGYRSKGGLRSESVSVIAYHESWQIEQPATLPVFVRDDAMGSGRTETAQGSTRFTTREVVDHGNELRGDYERDGVQRGTFRMLRSGPRAAQSGGPR